MPLNSASTKLRSAIDRVYVLFITTISLKSKKIKYDFIKSFYKALGYIVKFILWKNIII